jgi:hypothetical protein
VYCFQHQYTWSTCHVGAHCLQVAGIIVEWGCTPIGYLATSSEWGCTPIILGPQFSISASGQLYTVSKSTKWFVCFFLPWTSCSKTDVFLMQSCYHHPIPSLISVSATTVKLHQCVHDYHYSPYSLHNHNHNHNHNHDYSYSYNYNSTTTTLQLQLQLTEQPSSPLLSLPFHISSHVGCSRLFTSRLANVATRLEPSSGKSFPMNTELNVTECKLSCPFCSPQSCI